MIFYDRILSVGYVSFMGLFIKVCMFVDLFIIK